MNLLKENAKQQKFFCVCEMRRLIETSEKVKQINCMAANSNALALDVSRMRVMKVVLKCTFRLN